jgi:hypothetical protein
MSASNRRVFSWASVSAVAAYARLSRAHGYADGFMRAMLDAGLVERDELVRLVGDTRREFVERDDAANAAAAEASAEATAA